MKEPAQPNEFSPSFIHETQSLQEAWDRHSMDFLDQYLISNVEDPRINIQSILTRHFLIREVFGDYYEELMDHELRFGIAANWVLGLLKSCEYPYQLSQRTGDIFEVLTGQADDPGSVDVPAFLADSFRMLAFPNYIGEFLSWTPPDDPTNLPDYLIDTFGQIWMEALAEQADQTVSVIEPACGSANDYRFLDRFGISRFLQYTGFDLCGKNIQNAKRRFGSVDFQCGNVFDIPAEDQSFEYCFVHDLFEHLSVEGMTRSIEELCRVTSRKLCLHFFKMAEIDDHIVQKKNGYHWNCLSIQRIRDLLVPYSEKIDMIHIDSFLCERYGFSDTHNKQSYTWIVELKKRS